MKAAYKQCFNCGSYFIPKTDGKEDIFCKKECELKYVRCIVCGEFYDVDEGFDWSKSENFICSDNCRKKHKIDFKKDKNLLDFNKLK